MTSIAVKTTAEGQSAGPAAMAVSSVSVAARPAGAAVVLAASSTAAAPRVRVAAAALGKVVEGVSRTSVHVWPAEAGKKAVSASSSASAGLRSVSEAVAGAVLGVIRVAMGAVSSVASTPARDGLSSVRQAARPTVNPRKGASASPAHRVGIVARVVGSAEVIQFAVARVSISLASTAGGNKSRTGRALNRLADRLTLSALKSVDAIARGSVIVSARSVGTQTPPSSIVREIVGVTGRWDRDYDATGSAEES